jgi:hypothetical protein
MEVHPADETAFRRRALDRLPYDTHRGRDGCLSRFGAGRSSSFPPLAGLQRLRFGALDMVWSFKMPRVIAARNRNCAGCCRAGLGRCGCGLAYPDAAITITSFPSPQVGLALSGMLVGQSQWTDGSRRPAAEPRQTEDERSSAPVNKVHLTSQQRGRESRVRAGLRSGFEDAPQFTVGKREFRVYSLTRFPTWPIKNALKKQFCAV